MKQLMLGNTGTKVTEFCLGTLPMGPIQLDLPEAECIHIIKTALDYGVNFIDTAEAYKTEPYIGKALNDRNDRDNLVIATKANAETYQNMEKSVYNSLKELNTDYIDIYHIHAARGAVEVFQERKGALKCLEDMKKKGKIRHIGISTHSVQVVAKAAEIPEVEIVYPIINPKGIGIHDGSIHEMLDSVKKCCLAGKGMYAMKVLGGGNFIEDIPGHFDWALSVQGIHAISVGVTSVEEVKYNLSLFGIESLQGVEIPDTTQKKQLFIFSRHCIACGDCVNTCPNGALSIEEGEDGKESAVVNHDYCILCGYCSPVCPKFAIRMV